MFPKASEGIALVAGSKQFTYKQLLQSVYSISEQIECAEGDRVVIFSENRTEWILAFYAIWKKKAIPVPIDFMAGASDVGYIINDSAPSIIFYSEGCANVLQEALKGISTDATIVKIETLETEPKEVQSLDRPDFKDDDTAVIIYTSGTTGSPKGVMLSFDNIMANLEGVTRDVPIISGEDRIMVLLPLHHILPLVGSVIAPLYCQGMIAISPSLASEDVLETLKQHKITLIIGVPRFYNLIRKGILDKINSSAVARLLFALAGKLKSKRFSMKIFGAVHDKFGGHVRFLVSGGAALDIETSRDFETLGFNVLEGYGMTEAAPMITFTRPGKYVPGSAGQALPATNVEIRDGEIVAKGRNIMQGYYKRPEETAQVLKDGWLYSGDLGYMDKNGYIFITGRKKDILVLSNGKNINPVLVENKITAASPYIVEAGVFLKNDVLQAILIPDLIRMKNDGIDDYEKHIRWHILDPINKAASPYQRILKFYLSTEELPKTRLGKVQRFRLEAIAASQSLKKDIEFEEPKIKEYAIIRDYLQKETGIRIAPNDHLEMDIALDSLAKITLLVYLENTFGVKIPEDEFLSFPSVLKLAEHIHDKKKHTKVEAVNWSEILKEKVHVHLHRSKVTRAAVHGMLRFILSLIFRIRIRGKENIPAGPCIIAPNHQSSVDGVFITSFLKNRISKNTYVYAKEKYWRSGIMKFLARKNNIILMDISRDLKQSLQKMAYALQAGKKILIFPEGTRTRDGKLGDFKKTFAILSKELNVPVVPVAIDGSYHALPSGSWLPRFFSPIFIKYLKPINPQAYTYDSLNDEVRNNVMAQLTDNNIKKAG